MANSSLIHNSPLVLLFSLPPFSSFLPFLNLSLLLSLSDYLVRSGCQSSLQLALSLCLNLTYRD